MLRDPDAFPFFRWWFLQEGLAAFEVDGRDFVVRPELETALEFPRRFAPVAGALCFTGFVMQAEAILHDLIEWVPVGPDHGIKLERFLFYLHRHEDDVLQPALMAHQCSRAFAHEPGTAVLFR